MQLPRVEIQSQQAQIGMQQQKPEMSITQRPADISIDQELVGTLRISTTASKLHIDQSEAFADTGLKGPLRRNEEWGAQGKQSVMQYIAKTVQQGEQLKKIEHGTEAIAQLAKQNGERPTKEINVGFVPEHAFKVNFQYEPSDIQVDVDWPEPNIHVQKHDPEIHIPRWETNVYLQQKESIQFHAVDPTVNRTL
ncbi:DUF6470 family protein [Bacillus shivajii]|uniref:DUF6470 family protein n=1 Tax=Bacillus shivajii TaxID=1983719 RepID=UPI001CFA89D7|nr:DUF6470 family protein [Bacillus shivajii]UCZ52693.1 DUF6470 family protein [Bacillus shivajii]